MLARYSVAVTREYLNKNNHHALFYHLEAIGMEVKDGGHIYIICFRIQCATCSDFGINRDNIITFKKQPNAW